MTIKTMYTELREIGFPVKLIIKHTGLSEHKLKHMMKGNPARFTYSEVEAFNAYYDKAKKLADVYGDKLQEYLDKGDKL